MTKKRAPRKQKLVTVVTPVGYLTTTPKIAAQIMKKKTKKTKKR